MAQIVRTLLNNQIGFAQLNHNCFCIFYNQEQAGNNQKHFISVNLLFQSLIVILTFLNQTIHNLYLQYKMRITFISFFIIIDLLLVFAYAFDPNLIPNNQQIIISQLSQYFFVPSQFYFQYSLASWSSDEPQDNQILQQIIISYNVNFYQVVSPQYNFIVLQSNSSNNLLPYNQYNCYLRAIDEGVTEFMKQCNLGNTYISRNGSCSQQIATQAQSYFQNYNVFLNCTDSTFAYNITPPQNQNKGGLPNGTSLFIVDNSGLLFDFNNSIQQMNLILQTQIIASINTQEKAKAYLACGLLAIFIVILIIIAFIFNFKTRRYEKHIEKYRKDKVV